MKFTPATESEKTVLGGLLLDSEYFPAISEMLAPLDFYHDAHQQIFDCMVVLYKTYETFDVPMILDKTEISANYILELANNCPSLKNLQSHACIIREKAVQRKLLECAEEIKGPSCGIMEDDFQKFQFNIQPCFDENSDITDLVLVVLHHKSNKSTNLVIDSDELRQFGIGYLFGLMQDLVHVLKKKIDKNINTRTLADLHERE